MAGLKELQRRLVSVRNTRKITYAMKLVSAAKLRKAQEAVVQSREYTKTLFTLLADLRDAKDDAANFSHPFLEEREVKNILVLVAGGSRGLAGGYNANINRRIDSALRELAATRPGAKVEWILLGKKPGEYFRRLGRKYQASHEALPDEAVRWPILDVCAKVEKDVLEGRVDEVYLIYTRFRSALSVTPEFTKVLPFSVSAEELEKARSGEPRGKVLFEPSPEEVFASLVPRVFRQVVLQACLDSKASEHGSRMTAMDAATKNAGELIEKLQLQYNKLRQSGITAELLDIIGGAEAIR